MLVLPIVFYSAAGVLAYTYIGYPLAAQLLSRSAPRPVAKGDIQPTVSIVIAARNESSRIRAKLEDILATDYPLDKLEIIVVSDGSDDDTDAVVQEFARRHAPPGTDPKLAVHLLRQRDPRGKAAALNLGVARATGEIVAFMDSRQRVEPGALRRLVRAFADPAVGAASGELMIESDKGPGVYWRYEKLIRSAEARIDSVPGATGAFYAIRRDLFRPLPESLLLDDVYTPMQIVMQGYRVIFEEEARAWDHEAELAGEFRRKARTLAGNYQLVQELPSLLNPAKNRILWQFVSHKLLRLAGPAALAALFASSLGLSLVPSPGWPVYFVALNGQVLLYGLALYGALRTERAGRLARVSHTFVVLNAAAAEGLRRYLVGDLRWTR